MLVWKPVYGGFVVYSVWGEASVVEGLEGLRVVEMRVQDLILVGYAWSHVVYAPYYLLAVAY